MARTKGLLNARGPARLFAQAKPHRIDVHHHIVPPTWLAAMDIIGRRDFPLSNWSVQKSLEDMDKGGVATPQVTPLGKPAGLRITRESNDYAAKLAGDHPGRFGVFAMLPLPHVDESLKEIAYVFDTLKVDGVGLFLERNLGQAASDRLRIVSAVRSVVFAISLEPCMRVCPNSLVWLAST